MIFSTCLSVEQAKFPVVAILKLVPGSKSAAFAQTKYHLFVESPEEWIPATNAGMTQGGSALATNGPYVLETSTPYSAEACAIQCQKLSAKPANTMRSKVGLSSILCINTPTPAMVVCAQNPTSATLG